MGGYIKTWNKDQILTQLRQAYYTCSDPRQDGFVTWPIKQDLYQIKWELDNLIKKCPIYSPEAEFLKEHEQQLLVDILKNNYET